MTHTHAIQAGFFGNMMVIQKGHSHVSVLRIEKSGLGPPKCLHSKGSLIDDTDYSDRMLENIFRAWHK